MVSLTDAQILAAVNRMTSTNGDDAPTNIEYVTTTEGAAMQLAYGASADPAEASDAVVLTVALGHFTGTSAKVPASAPPPTGTVMTVVVDGATGAIRDWGITDKSPALTSLGTPTVLR